MQMTPARFGRRKLVAVILLLGSAIGIGLYLRGKSPDDAVRQLGGTIFQRFYGPKWVENAASNVPKGQKIIRTLSATERVVADGLPLTDGDVAELAQNQRLISLYLKDTPITDMALGPISKLRSLQVLRLDGTGITDAGLGKLRNMRSLSSLEVGAPAITDDGLKHLSGLTEIKYLSLDGTHVRGPGLSELRALTKLDTLRLAGSAITDDGLEHLHDLTISYLLDVFLNDTGITDAGLVHFREVPVGFISLAGSKITDAGMPHLADCAKLTALDVSNTGLTNEGLDCLGRFPKLLWVNVTSTQVTGDFVQDFRARCPQIHVEFGDRPSQQGGATAGMSRAN